MLLNQKAFLVRSLKAFLAKISENNWFDYPGYRGGSACIFLHRLQDGRANQVTMASKCAPFNSSNEVMGGHPWF